MRKKILILCGVLIFTLMGISSVRAQFDPDPGNRDTLWVERINMSGTIFGAFGKDFAVKCSIYTDEDLGGFVIPLIFYHDRNKDIYADSVTYESWVGIGTAAVANFTAHNGNSGDTAKTCQFGAVWVTGGFPATHPTQKLFCKIWFHTGKPYHTFDTTKSIVLDTCTYYPPPTGNEFYFTTQMAVSFQPVFVPGAVGYPRTISGKVSGAGVLPKPDAQYTLYVSGDRKEEVTTDNSGNYSYLVGKGGRWIVFRDSLVARYTLTDPLVRDTSGLNFVGTSDVREVVSEEKVLPEAFSLDQNYPNPFNPNTMIRFSLPKDCWVKLEVYNLLGQKVKTLVDQMLLAGTKEVVWDGKNQAGALVSSGIYFYRIQTKDFTDIKKMVLVK